jgi:hypothetical protein
MYVRKFAYLFLICMCEVLGHLSGNLFKKTLFFLFIFLKYLYLFEYHGGIPQGCNIPVHLCRAMILQKTLLFSTQHTVTYPSSNWAMPHKFFKLCAIKTYTHITLTEIYIYNVNRQINYVNARIHTKITVTIYMHYPYI